MSIPVEAAPTVPAASGLSLTEDHLRLQLFAGYDASEVELLKRFQAPDAKPEAGFVVDFLGSRTRASSLWTAARGLEGQVLGIPEPGDYHAETIEWLGVITAVQRATDQYTAMELGAGFAPWSIAGALAARLRGIEKVKLYAVEADPYHFRLAREHFLDNGLNPDEHVLIEAAVGVDDGLVQWPALGEKAAAEDFGCRPIGVGEEYRGTRVATTAVRLMALSGLLRREPFWDLIHLDVQGHEVDICRSCIADLTHRVRRMVVATHSRKLDGDLMDLMYSARWFLEREKPCRLAFSANAPSLEAMTLVDGTQVWRNPAFEA